MPPQVYGTMPPQQVPTGRQLDHHPLQPFKRTFSPENIFIGTGILLLCMLCVVPIWNAASLLQDFNYVFWAGRAVPLWLIFLSIIMIVVYVITILSFFAYSRPSVRTEQTIMMIAQIFITLLGLILMLISLPLSKQSIETYNNLMHRCDFSEQTHRMYEYSQVLHNIRAQPECAKKFTVEECNGYESAPPYTTFLKEMESDFRCSGFCWKANPLLDGAPAPAPAPAAAPGAPAPAKGKGKGAPGPAPAKKKGLVHVSRHLHHRHEDTVTSIAFNQQGANMSAFSRDTQRPPTLFSDANYRASCEGMAARDMRNFAGDIGFQTFYQGIYLVLIAICTGFLKLIGFCVRRDSDRELLVNKQQVLM
jgi:hypothetical protein